jgi:amidohydrolase
VERLSRRLFALRELSLQETASSALLRAFLRRHGFRVQAGAGGLPTAFVARRRVGRGGPRIGLLAEYDALPDIGHACGHNLIGAAACGAAVLAARLLDGDAAEIVVYGTPAEETIGGKIVLARRGLFRGLDAALMFHPSTEDRVYMTSLACHSFEVVFRGRAAHAVASPEKGINALAALLALFAAMDRLRPSLPVEARMPGIITEGGRRPNIVPDRAVGRFTLRAGDLRRLARVKQAFFAAGRAAAKSVGARVEFRAVDLPYAEMRTNGPLAEVFKEELWALGRTTVDTPRKGMGSLDMGNVSQVVPSIHPFVAIAPKIAPLHSRLFARRAGGSAGRRGLEIASRALAATLVRAVRDPELLRAARRAFVAGGPRSGAPRAGRGAR